MLIVNRFFVYVPIVFLRLILWFNGHWSSTLVKRIGQAMHYQLRRCVWQCELDNRIVVSSVRSSRDFTSCIQTMENAQRHSVPPLFTEQSGDKCKFLFSKTWPLVHLCAFRTSESHCFPDFLCVPFKKRLSIYIKVTNDYHVGNTVPRGGWNDNFPSD